jgi:carboxyl-terminal processing protease
MSAGAIAVAGAGVLWLERPLIGPHEAHVPFAPPSPPSASAAAATPGDDAAPAASDDTRSHEFRIPSGRAPSLSCDAARTIVAQARSQLGYVPDRVDANAFVDAAVDWLDPYGLWSVSPDAVVAGAFEKRSTEMIAELEGRGSHNCDAARALGAAIVPWVSDLRAVFDDARAHASTEDAETAASAPAFEGATVTRPAKTLADSLGRRIGAIERDLGPAAKPYVDAARARYFPDASASDWAGVVLAAAVRAYVPAIDPHGAWAPLDEESSVYEVDLEAHPPLRLWDKAERTAIGLKIETGATPPLADGDVVLSLAGVATAGLSYEQTEQLGFAASDQQPAAQAIVLRAGEKAPVTTWLDASGAAPKTASASGAEDDELPVERIEYGEGDAIVVTIHDVRDDLGEELTRAILRERERQGRTISGVVLDVRGNGGGSTDGANAAIGLFLPGARLFPMRRRDGVIETERAPEPPETDRWHGPVTALVDNDTASAAEMIAGALASYRRGAVAGYRTYGKGCAQEYLDDEAKSGVLRLTTLVYSLPDGTPVQKVGLLPGLFLGSKVASEREATLSHALPTWRGPDVRDRDRIAEVPWPGHHGRVGPCRDEAMCRTLRTLGAPRTAVARGRR